MRWQNGTKIVLVHLDIDRLVKLPTVRVDIPCVVGVTLFVKIKKLINNLSRGNNVLPAYKIMFVQDERMIEWSLSVGVFI